MVVDMNNLNMPQMLLIQQVGTFIGNAAREETYFGGVLAEDAFNAFCDLLGAVPPGPQRDKFRRALVNP